jgi:hypothetical protein
MSAYEALKQELGAAEPEERLKALRDELRRPIITVQGVAELLRRIDNDLVLCLPPEVSPDEFKRLIQWLSDAGADLRAILDALTEPEKAT